MIYYSNGRYIGANHHSVSFSYSGDSRPIYSDVSNGAYQRKRYYLDCERYANPDSHIERQHTLGEGFTATVYLVNTRSEEIQMEPITGLNIEGRSVNGTGGLVTFIDWFPAAGTVTILPANSKKKLVDKYFTPEQTGEFIITCLGEKKTVLIIEPIAEHVDEKYKISRGEARDIAVEAAGSIEWVDIDAKIWYMESYWTTRPSRSTSGL